MDDRRGLHFQIREPYTMDPFVLCRDSLDTELMGSGTERSIQERV
jgi:hypothetical protein